MFDMRRREVITIALLRQLRRRRGRSRRARSSRGSRSLGSLTANRPVTSRQIVAAFHQGLNEARFIEGRNVAIEYRWGKTTMTDFRCWLQT